MTGTPAERLRILRVSIDTVDASLGRLLQQRVKLSQEAQAVKREAGLPRVDGDRERTILERVPADLRPVFEQLLEVCRGPLAEGGS